MLPMAFSLPSTGQGEGHLTMEARQPTSEMASLLHWLRLRLSPLCLWNEFSGSSPPCSGLSHFPSYPFVLPSPPPTYCVSILHSLPPPCSQYSFLDILLPLSFLCSSSPFCVFIFPTTATNPNPNRSPLCPEALRVAARIYSSPPPNTRPAWQVQPEFSPFPSA